MESLKEKTANGLLWGGLNNGVQQLMGLVFGIILGRLLAPADYGMIAMISVFSLVANELQNSGFKAALTNLDHPTDRDYNSVFWFNITVSVTLYIILFLAAPFIAAYYRTPELTALCRYFFLGFIAAGLGTVQSAWLFKNIKAKQQAKTGITAIALSCTVGTAMAIGGFSYWALATQNLVFISVHTLMLWHYSPWRPSFCIDFGPAGRMFKFSYKLLLSNIINHLNTNVLNVLLGRFFSPRATGYYNQAYQWNSKCCYLLQGMVQTVAQPVFVELRDDSCRQLAALRKLMSMTAFISFPLLLGFGLVSNEFIIVTITEKWQASVPFIKTLSICGGFMPLSFILSQLVVSKGCSGTFMWCNATLGVLQIVLMVMLYPYGIYKMVATYTAVNILWFFVWRHLAGQLTGYTVTMAIADIMPFALSALAVMTATGIVTASINNLYVLLAARIALAAVLYYGLMHIISPNILGECMRFVKSKIKK